MLRPPRQEESRIQVQVCERCTRSLSPRTALRLGRSCAASLLRPTMRLPFEGRKLMNGHGQMSDSHLARLSCGGALLTRGPSIRTWRAPQPRLFAARRGGTRRNDLALDGSLAGSRSVGSSATPTWPQNAKHGASDLG